MRFIQVFGPSIFQEKDDSFAANGWGFYYHLWGFPLF